MKKLAAILNRKFSDRLNPVWVKEMRQMLNGRALLGSAAALIIAGLLFSYRACLEGLTAVRILLSFCILSVTGSSC